jgi:hypothetical protein
MIALFCGKREEGKTTRALALALAYSPRVLILDHRSQFGEHIILPDGGTVHATACTTLEELWEALDKGGVVIYRLELDVGSNQDAEIDQVIEVVREVWLRGRENCPGGRFTFLVDEAAELMKTGRMAGALHRMIRQIRLDTVQVFLLAHRPKDISTSFRSLITDIYIFNCTDPLDIEWLEQAGVTEEDIERIKALPLRHHLHLTLRTRDAHAELFDKPEEWNVRWRETAYA